MKYQAILFDLDNTLIDDHHATRTALPIWAKQIGAPNDPDHWLKVEHFWYHAYERGEVSHLGQGYARIRSYLRDPSLSDAEAAELLDQFLIPYIAAATAFPDAPAALETALATTAKVGILTNGTREMQIQKMTQAGLWDDRLTMLAARELGVGKPNRECYHRALSLIDVPTNQAILIGDSVENDVRGALDAGLDAIHLNRIGAPNSEFPTITSLDELVW